jgi:plastocyanin
VAQNITFSPSTINAVGGGTIVLTLDNRDAGVPHDFVLFTPGGAMLAQTDLVEGPGQASVTFTLDGAGRYAFKCSVHPRDMTGAIVVP